MRFSEVFRRHKEAKLGPLRSDSFKSQPSGIALGWLPEALVLERGSQKVLNTLHVGRQVSFKRRNLFLLCAYMVMGVGSNVIPQSLFFFFCFFVFKSGHRTCHLAWSLPTRIG